MFSKQQRQLGVLLASIPKADLLLSPPTATNRTCSGVLAITNNGFALQPSIDFRPGSTGDVVVAAQNDGTDFMPHSVLKSFLALNTTNATATLHSNLDISVPPYNVPINPPQPNGMGTL